MGTLHGTWKRLMAIAEDAERRRDLMDFAEADRLAGVVCSSDDGRIALADLRAIATLTGHLDDWWRFIRASLAGLPSGQSEDSADSLLTLTADRI